jgi:archaellum component FlaC
MDDDNRREHRSIEERLEDIENLLLRLLTQEEDMAANQSAEAQALQAAIDALNAEIADTSTVDDEIVAEIKTLQESLAKVEPVSPEQVNAVTAATTSLAALTAKLKGTVPIAPVPPVEPAPPVETPPVEATTPPAEPAPGEAEPVPGEATPPAQGGTTPTQ